MNGKFAVVTTFNQHGLEFYAQRMIDSYAKTWPHEVRLWIYPEQCDPHLPENLSCSVVPLENVQDLVRFKNTWSLVPKANGDISQDPVRSKRKDAHKRFKWDAVRFSHKVYSIFDCAQKCHADWLLWMDADMVCHSPITTSELAVFCPDDRDLCFVGRAGKFSECGLYALNLRSHRTLSFLKQFKNFYDDAERGIFTLDEWHDSFVFDAVRNQCSDLVGLDWASDLGDLRPHATNSRGEGHPLINSAWGAYLDHLKGDRKRNGRSLAKDIKVAREEPYWR